MNVEVIEIGTSVKRDCVWKTLGRILEGFWKRTGTAAQGCSWERNSLSDPISEE